MNDDDSKTVKWTRKIPLTTNTYVLKQLFIVLIIAMVPLFLLLVILDPDMLFEIIQIVGLVFGIMVVLAVISLILLQVTTRGGIEATFTLNGKSMLYEAGKNSKSLNRFTAAGAILAGSPSALGGSLINISRETESMKWREVHKVTAYDSQKTIVAGRKNMISPMGLFCTDENYEEVINFVETHIPSNVILIRK
ncbi:hypothetical protein F1737_03945 [Methanoplanus sp. FWC-SCC4]|uniref:Uncharacterized protein n=1 Tax=Methanochimaera problematica TaxID=2609417 RepID=A0AA97FB92_9EURY|nr:hypothetical protein [Methanoplanus sp. FWC-SCC4]WOF15907.1 hypothetical protein F1737_03945 [Methanoplanus sp. FWC-SCC4]